jgi:hypothetical protein
MSSHLAVIAEPVRAVRPLELGLTGISGRRVIRRSDLRAELRHAFLRSAGKHRVTFIPLGK